MAEEVRWYAIQTYSGHENKVKRLIDHRIGEEPGETIEEKEIQEAIVPTQDVVEIKNGKRVTVTKRLYPGYVLVKMALNQRSEERRVGKECRTRGWRDDDKKKER